MSKWTATLRLASGELIDATARYLLDSIDPYDGVNVIAWAEKQWDLATDDSEWSVFLETLTGDSDDYSTEHRWYETT